MSLFQWGPAYELGVTEVDNQHKKLARLINDLHDAHQSNAEKSVLGNIIEELIFYTKIHFNNEEKYMEDLGYQGLAEHREIHHKFTNQIVQFKEDFLSGNANVGADLLELLKNWLADHILVEDKKYTY
ncbi:MAG TPA: bacteriohemerythrin [Candidatus Kapabacteria bacterium]|nr:bacteriohemerythrin [Candidatus Kapabacteria bacterium]